MAKLKEEILNLILNVKGDNARKEINDTINAISDGKAKVKEMKSEMPCRQQPLADVSTPGRG